MIDGNVTNKGWQTTHAVIVSGVPDPSVCMKVRFKSKVTRGFSFSPLHDSCSPRGSLTALSCGEKSRKTSGTRVHQSLTIT